MVRNGDLGRIRFVAAEETRIGLGVGAGRSVGAWIPAAVGPPAPVADVGTHAFSPAALHHRAGGQPKSPARTHDTGPRDGQVVSTNATMRLTLSNGAPATVWADHGGHRPRSTACIFGCSATNASLEWRATKIRST